MSWTKSLPSETGYYWYRECATDPAPRVAEWDMEMGALQFTGTDLMRWSDAGTSGLSEIDGEFWPVKIEPPKA